MTPLTPLPSPFHREPFSTRAALDAGVTPARLRARDLAAPFSGVRVPIEPTTTRELALAFAPRMTERQYFSHLTAALLYGTPLPWRFERTQILDVSVGAPDHRPRRAGIRGHLSAAPAPVRVREGLRVLAPAQAWCQLAAYLNHDELVVAGDHLVRRKWPASTLAELTDAVTELGSRRHARALRAALEHVRAGTDSPRETRLRLLLVASGLPEPLVGYEVRSAFGFVGTPDLAYPAQKIAIEYEGSIHQEDRTTYVDDVRRRAEFERAGWKVILVLKEHDPAEVVERVRAALAEHA